MKESGRNIVHFFLRTLVILFLLALSGLVFVVSSDYPDFTVQARQFAFWSLMPWLNLLALTIVLFDKSFRFILTDALVVAFSIYVAIHFQLKESVTEGRLITFLLLINLYYILRVFQSFWRQTRRWALLSVCLAGIIQAIIGLKQIYGYSFSYHSLYGKNG